jgi:tRNA splicing ligase
MQPRVKAYQIDDNDLYKTSVSNPLVRCISKAKDQQLLSEIHTGICGGYIGVRALVAKVLRQCFYWPVVINDAVKLIATCKTCQKFSHRSKAPALPSQLIAPS